MDPPSIPERGKRENIVASPGAVRRNTTKKEMPKEQILRPKTLPKNHVRFRTVEQPSPKALDSTTDLFESDDLTLNQNQLALIFRGIRSSLHLLDPTYTPSENEESSSTISFSSSANELDVEDGVQDFEKGLKQFHPGFSKKDFLSVRRLTISPNKRVRMQIGNSTPVTERIINSSYSHLSPLSSPLSQSDEELIVKEYSPRVFCDIRNLYSLTTESFIESWNLDPENLKLTTGAGRSGSLFFFSKDRRFILKTIPYPELVSLRTVLARYHKHLHENPTSLLMKFFALFRFQFSSQTMYVILGNNVIYTPNPKDIRQIWDLKGRKPKPGKALRQRTVSVSKDNDLNRTFDLTHDKRETLLWDIKRDILFLRENNLMDYSFLAGTIGEPPPELKEYVSFEVPAFQTLLRLPKIPFLDDQSPNHECPLCTRQTASPFPGIPLRRNAPLQSPTRTFQSSFSRPSSSSSFSSSSPSFHRLNATFGSAEGAPCQIEVKGILF